MDGRLSFKRKWESMPDLAAGFHSLPAEFQEVIRLAQARYNVSVTPLQALTGGWSGASIYLVSVAFHESQRVEHLILKLDHKNEKARSDEITRHQDALRLSPPGFASQHIARMLFERVEQDGAVAIFYDIAGQSLQQFRPLSAFESQSQLETLFVEACRRLLSDWNAGGEFRQAVLPQYLLEQWLGFRIKPGAPIEHFLQDTCQVPVDMPGMLVQDTLLPNPLIYARDASLWGSVRPIDVLTGLQHGDLNTNNILVKFNRAGKSIEGFYLIDFALFKEQMPLLFDLRYLEMSYLLFKQAQVPFHKLAELLIRYSEVDRIDPLQVPIELAGVCAMINASRQAFERWLRENHPSLSDDLWGQYLLAGAAAGLSYTHKVTLSTKERLAGLLFSAANFKRFAALFGIAPPAEGRQVCAPGRLSEERPVRSAGQPAPKKTPHNLPADYSSFIGREAEIKTVCELLSAPDVRLVTLTGPGGVGKTRLALKAAAVLLKTFPDGVFFVPLAEITDPETVIPRIARVLEVRENASQPLLEVLKEFLRDQRLLLVLDNLEQVASAAPALLDLLGTAPGLKILSTSRVLLQVRGEQEFAVPPLSTPGRTSAFPDLQQINQYESVRLFVERARSVDPGFALGEAEAPVIIEICQRLDGLPLAIELAAARTKLLPPRALLNRLGSRLAVLTGGPHDLPSRQQTLRNTLDWSHSLLQAAEQALFARLGIFVGGCSLEIAETVCNLDGSLDVLEGISTLLNNSLLRQEVGPHGQPRFRMLETIREYALEKLEQRGEKTTMQASHGTYYIEKMDQEVRFKLSSPETTYWLDWVESEHDNIQAALAWGQEIPEMTMRIPRLSPQLAWFWYRRGYYQVGRAWTDRWLADPQMQREPRERAYTLLTGSLMAGWQGDLKMALARGRESLAIFQRLEDDEDIMFGMICLGAAEINQGNDAGAFPLYQQAQVIAEQLGLTYFDIVARVHLGNVALGQGNLSEALRWQQEAYAISREYGDGWLISFALNNLGEVSRAQGDYAQARAYYKQSESLLREMGDKGDLARLVSSLGYTALHEGDFAKAREHFLESLALFRRLGNKRGIAENLAALANLRAREGQLILAAQVLSAAEAMMAENGASWWPADRVEIQRCREAIRAGLEESVFSAAWASGQALKPDQAAALAVDGKD